MKEKIKPLYEELKGMLSAMPEENLILDKGISEKYNATVSKISGLIPEIVASEYLIQSEFISLQFGGGDQRINKNHYKMKLSALLGQLRGRFDFDSAVNTSGGHTFIQNQTVSVEFVLNLQEKIIELIEKQEKGTAERTFLEKVKESIASIKNGTDIVKTVLVEANKAGISLEKLVSIFT